MQDQKRIGRRTFFGRGAALAGGTAAASLIEIGCGSKTEAANGTSGPLIVAGDGNATVETKTVNGKKYNVELLGNQSLWDAAPVENPHPPNPLKNDTPFLKVFPYFAEPW